MFTHLLRVADPTPHVHPFARELDSLFFDLVRPRVRPSPKSAASGVHDEGEHYRVVLDVPGLKAEDLKIEATEEGLTIEGERSLAPPEGFVVRRSERRPYRVAKNLSFPTKVDPEAVEATFEQGVLTVTLAKRAEAKPRSITVRTVAA